MSRSGRPRRNEHPVGRLLESISLEGEPGAVADGMLRVIGEHAGADCCYFCRFADGGEGVSEWLGEWVNPALGAVAPYWRDGEMAVYRGLAGKRRPLVIGDSARPPKNLPARAAKALAEHGVRSRLVCGVWGGGRLYGLIGVDHIRRRKHFSDSVIYMAECCANLFRLVCERAGQHERLLESVSRQKQIMDNIAVPILLIDLDFRVLAANPNKKVNVDLPLDQLLGTHCYDTFCKCGAPPEFCAANETMRTKRSSSKEFSFGPKRLVSTAQPIFDRSGEMQCVLSVDLDITEVTRQKEELKAAMEQAQAASQAKSYFLATVSHELRTPLNAVIGFTELLRNGDLDERTRQEYLYSIHFAGNGLLNLINDVLDLSNLEADQTVLVPARCDVADLIQQIAAVFKFKTTEKELELTTDTGRLRHPLYVDSQRLRQILLNLIGNAIKVTAKGGVTVTAAFEPGDGETGTLLIRISDTGIGILPEHQERIFEPFVHDSVLRGERLYEGSGLGLTITRRLLAKMGGDIRLESKAGEGSTFSIRLDGVRYDPAPAEPASPASEKPSAAVIRLAGKTMRVMLVDDLPINLKVLAAMLKLLDVESVSAGSAAEAEALLREDSAYDMILTDMWMPEVSGVELAERIKRGRLADSPVAAVTADTQMAEKDRQWFDYILYKPVTLDSLREMFRTVLLTD